MVFDLVISTVYLVALGPVFSFQLLFWHSLIERKNVIISTKKYSILSSLKSSLFTFMLNMVNIWRRQLSFVGAPFNLDNTLLSKFVYKTGLTGIIQTNLQKITTAQIYEKYELHYLKNQSIFIDLEILYKHIFKKKSSI